MSDLSVGAALARLFKCGPTGSSEDYDAVFGALERARVVGVLDAWQQKHTGYSGYFSWRTWQVATDQFSCSVSWRAKDGKDDYRDFFGATPDAARAAAAKAIEAREV